MHKSLCLSLIPLLISLTACNANSDIKSQTQNAQTHTITQTQTTQKAEGLWIDVRSSDEYQAGHLTGAVNIPHTTLAEQIATLAPNKSTPIHLYCHSGRRAKIALTTLQNLGYTNVQNHGGYQELLNQGLR